MQADCTFNSSVIQSARLTTEAMNATADMREKCFIASVNKTRGTFHLMQVEVACLGLHMDSCVRCSQVVHQSIACCGAAMRSSNDL